MAKRNPPTKRVPSVSRDERAQVLETTFRATTAALKIHDPASGKTFSLSATPLFAQVDDGLSKEAKARTDHSRGGRESSERKRISNVARDNQIWLDYQILLKAGTTPCFIAGKLERKYAGTDKALTARQIRTIIANKKSGN